jgi:hypothetical protein
MVDNEIMRECLSKAAEDFEFALINLDDLEKSQLTDGFDCRGVPPMAGLRALYRARTACP